MKLFERYNQINITATILTFIIGSVAFYFVLQYVLVRQLDETLKGEQQEVVDYIKLHNQLPEIQNTKHQWINVRLITQPIQIPKAISIPHYNKEEDEVEYIRQLKFTVFASNKLFEVSVNKSETETEDLLKLIILVTVGMIGFILLLNNIINRKLVTSLWQPFYTTIGRIKDYNMSIHQPLELKNEAIEEIDLLNDSLNKMTKRIYQDYSALRSFTENASHEMQTPLAIIQSKVETLLQDTEATEKTVDQLLTIEDATQKLAKLHQSLLLLTKLENRQYSQTENVDMKEIIETKFGERKELLAVKQIKYHLQCEPVNLYFHKHLAEILISNLLNNAIKYTPENGEIEIQLTMKSLSIKNTAIKNELDSQKVFRRFYKADQTVDGTGLGLAIIKEICTLAGYRITYHYNENKHDFTILFSVGKG